MRRTWLLLFLASSLYATPHVRLPVWFEAGDSDGFAVRTGSGTYHLTASGGLRLSPRLEMRLAGGVPRPWIVSFEPSSRLHQRSPRQRFPPDGAPVCRSMAASDSRGSIRASISYSTASKPNWNTISKCPRACPRKGLSLSSTARKASPRLFRRVDRPRARRRCSLPSPPCSAGR